MFSRCLVSSLRSKIGTFSNGSRCFAAQMSSYNYETVKVETVSEYVMSVSLNRPEKRNAMNKIMWMEIGEVFKQLGNDPKCRSIILSGEGKMLSAGIDLKELMAIGQVVMSDDDVARKCRAVHNISTPFHESFSQLEKCPKPVIAAIWGPCVGAAVDLICGTDIRFCSQDTWFQVKEVEMGLAADVGTLQRLPKIIGSQSLVNDLCLTCRKMPSDEALTSGLVSRVLPDKDATMKAAVECAEQIASNSPVATQATKMTLIHARDHTVQEGLEYVALLNMAFLQSEDVRISAMSQMQKDSEKPQFADF